jgi:hypothetical protein
MKLAEDFRNVGQDETQPDNRKESLHVTSHVSTMDIRITLQTTGLGIMKLPGIQRNKLQCGKFV